MSAAPQIDTELEGFRAEARAWIQANFPKSLKDQIGLSFTEGPGSTDPDFLQWKAAMGNKGWSVPTWPTQWGGGGLSKAQARVLQQEMNKAGAFNPMAGGMGVSMLGPTLLEYGTEAQKKQHLPSIVHGKLRWCQGYSEPGAGSDLASLRTQALDKGDHFLVNGQKIWTSGAQYADWCFCLVRTDNTRKHEGISFVLIDMKTPGVEVRPIKLISGDSPFCETFFTDVKVPKENLVGQLNGGWTIGKRLLQFERENQGSMRVVSLHGADTRSIAEIAKSYVGTDDSGRIADPDLRARIADHEMDAEAMRLTLQRVADNARAKQGPSAVTSILKNANVRNNQTRDELMLEIMGMQGLGWEGASYSKSELGAIRNCLVNKAQSIAGGSNEVQNNIISKRILGLPDHITTK